MMIEEIYGPIGISHQKKLCSISMLRNILGPMVIALALSTPARADTLKVMGAGSLRAVMTDLLHRFPIQSDTVVPPEFGPSGLLRQKIENGAKVDVFTSADMQQPRRLAAGHPDRLVILFARNSLCTLARPDLGLNQTNLLDRLLDPAVRIATSTPDADPLGTYSWEVFARADATQARCARDAGSEGKKTGRRRREDTASGAGKGAVEGIFLSDQADVMLIYCSAVPALQKEMPSLTSIKLPAALTVEPANGMVILDAKPVALRFVAFVMSEQGQAILRSHGFEPVASVAADRP